MIKDRNYGLDMLRIIAIILITVIHYIEYSNILLLDNLLPINRGAMVFFDTLSKSAVNLFVIITGFFQCEKKFKLGKIFDLWAQVWIFSVLLLIFASVLLGNFSFANLIKSVLPLSTFRFWFLTSYMMLYLISPCINILLERANKSHHKLACILGGIVICVFFVMNPFGSEEVYLGHYHGICWFIYLYIVGAYLNKYDISVWLKKYKLILTLAVAGLIYFIRYFNIGTLQRLLSDGYYSLLTFALSIMLFIMFKDIKVKNNFAKKVLIELSACSFFVYIFQEHTMIRSWYWGLFNIPQYADSAFLIFNFVIALLAVWPAAFVYGKLYNKFLKNIIANVYKKFTEFNKLKS